MVFGIIIIAIVLIIIITIIVEFNSLVRLNQQSDEAWSDITVQLKRRYDLIPNLVSTVQGYAKHEKTVFEDVTEARSKALSATSVADQSAAENQFQQTMKSLFAVAENYPDLKASQNFQELQAQLTDTEDKIQASRRFYNGIVRDFNTKRKTFPTNLISGILGFNKDKEYFEVGEAEEANIQKTVEVKF